MVFSESEWFPESIYTNWLADSLILMTSALLFYHMVQKESLNIDYRIAAFFAVSLIFCSVGIGSVSLYPYFQRMREVLENTQEEKTEQAKKERVYRNLYTVFGGIIILIQVGIAIFIIRGVILHKK
jgi:hypothetical protein